MPYIKHSPGQLMDIISREKAKIDRNSPGLEERFQYHTECYNNHVPLMKHLMYGKEPNNSTEYEFEIDIPDCFMDDVKEIFADNKDYEIAIEKNTNGNVMKVKGSIVGNEDFLEKFSTYSFYYTQYHRTCHSYVEWLLKK